MLRLASLPFAVPHVGGLTIDEILGAAVLGLALFGRTRGDRPCRMGDILTATVYKIDLAASGELASVPRVERLCVPLLASLIMSFFT